MIFTKESLLGSSYSWFPDNSKLITDRFPTRKGFDRMSGDAMLRMINLFDLLVSKLTLAEGHSMERSLVKELPVQMASEMSVFNWLKHRYLYESKIK